MRNFCVDAVKQLDECPIHDFGRLFVELKMEFARKFQCKDNLITSTTLGPEFFKQVINCIDGEEWSTKLYKGKYEDNFRTLIQNGRKMS